MSSTLARRPPGRRSFPVALGVSLLLHALLLALVPRPPPTQPPGPVASEPLNVVIVAPPQAAPVEAPPPPEVAPPVAVPRPSAPRRAPAPRKPSPLPDLPVEPGPVPPAAPVDMLAAIEARRAQRRAAEAAAAGAAPSPAAPAPAEDAAARNLQTLSGREGVGGVFQILRKGVRTAEFAFNGWRPGGARQWRQVIEVDAGPGGDIELAIVRRMIELIRTHYSGDFYWESHRLGRTVTLSARPEDSERLEDFLQREFFDAPTVNPRAPSFLKPRGSAPAP